MTRAKAEAAAKAKGGTLIDNSTRSAWAVLIEAPSGYHWGDSHCRSMFWHPVGPKAEFWEAVIDEIAELEATPCASDPWCREGSDSCEYWGKNNACTKAGLALYSPY